LASVAAFVKTPALPSNLIIQWIEFGCIGTRAGLTNMPIMPWHGAPRFRGPPWAAQIF